MLHSCMSVVCTYHCRGFLKKIFFLQGNLKGGRIEDHKMMFTGHLHLPQLSNSPVNHWYNSYNASSENLVLDQLSPNWHFSLFSLFIWLKLYSYCREKFCLGHSWPGVKGLSLVRFACSVSNCQCGLDSYKMSAG